MTVKILLLLFCFAKQEDKQEIDVLSASQRHGEFGISDIAALGLDATISFSGP